MTEHQIPLIFSSSESNGARNKSSSGDYFEILLSSPILIPREAKVATIELNSATVWNTVYNISVLRKNNNFRYIEDNVNYDVVIPNGLYTLAQLASSIDRELVNQGRAPGKLKFVGDIATQKVVINFTQDVQQVDFTIANSCREILGFDAAIYPAIPTTTATYVVAPNIASFNVIDYYLLRCDIISSGGIPINGQYKGVIAKMPITAPPGSQSVYQPFNPMRVPLNNRRGELIKNVEVRITDQAGRSIELTDDFSIDCILRYVV